jgi:ABC-type multidrug transport system ATPase subunit
VLILDEPANGLDPEGMRWMRGLLRDFADRGGTVLLSSHLLAEVEAVAGTVVARLAMANDVVLRRSRRRRAPASNAATSS